jgi:hypothetical protein
MNKKLLLIGISFAFISANAQFNAGQRILSGNISGRIGKDNIENVSTQSKFNLTFVPTIGKFKDSRTLNSYGLILGIENQNSKVTNGDFNEGNGFRLGVTYTRTKLYPLTKDFYFTLGFGGDITYFNLKNRAQQPNYHGEQNMISAAIGVTPGLMFPLNKKILLQTGFNNLATISFFTSTFTEKLPTNVVNKNTRSALGFNAGSSVGAASLFYIGFSAFL